MKRKQITEPLKLKQSIERGFALLKQMDSPPAHLHEELIRYVAREYAPRPIDSFIPAPVQSLDDLLVSIRHHLEQETQRKKEMMDAQLAMTLHSLCFEQHAQFEQHGNMHIWRISKDDPRFAYVHNELRIHVERRYPGIQDTVELYIIQREGEDITAHAAAKRDGQTPVTVFLHQSEH